MILAHIFLPKKFMIVAHFFWEVIVSDLAHEKSELAQLCIYYKNLSSPGREFTDKKNLFDISK